MIKRIENTTVVTALRKTNMNRRSKCSRLED